MRHTGSPFRIVDGIVVMIYHNRNAAKTVLKKCIVYNTQNIQLLHGYVRDRPPERRRRLPTRYQEHNVRPSQRRQGEIEGNEKR